MPRRTVPSSQATARGAPPPPTAGALLRMTYQGIRERQFAAVIAKGFEDLNQPLLNVFLYPPSDRTRPSELAEGQYGQASDELSAGSARSSRLH